MASTREYLRNQTDFDNRVTVIDTVVVGSNGQTVFPGALSREPLDPLRVVLSVNGVKYTNPGYFTLGGVGNIDMTWLDNGFTLETTDEVYVDYFPAD